MRKSSQEDEDGRVVAHIMNVEDDTKLLNQRPINLRALDSQEKEQPGRKELERRDVDLFVMHQR